MSIYPSVCGGYTVPTYSSTGCSPAGCEPYPKPSGDWTYRGLWAEGTAYASGDLVVPCGDYETPSDGTIYQAIQTHCADEMSRPGTGPDWMRIWRAYAVPGSPAPIPPLCPGDDVPDDLAQHETDTTDVHGIPDTTKLVTKEQMNQAIADALAAGNWETPEGAQQKADAALEAAIAHADECCMTVTDAFHAADSAHTAACHTLETVTADGVTPEDGWEVDEQELSSLGGTHTVFIRLRRTGGDLVGVDGDFTNSDGKTEEGNIIPDLKIATVAEGWRPSQTFLVFGDNSYGHGGVRVHGNGDIYLTDWMTNNTIQNGYLLRFEYTFLTKSPCEESGS